VIYITRSALAINKPEVLLLLAFQSSSGDYNIDNYLTHLFNARARKTKIALKYNKFIMQFFFLLILYNIILLFKLNNNIIFSIGHKNNVLCTER